MRILNWNILHGGGRIRTPEILLALLRHDADLIVLTEFRAPRGSQLRSVLADHGLTHQLASHPPTRENANGVLIASRHALAPDPTDHPPRDARGRWLAACVPALHLSLLAVHVPDDTRPTAKAAFWQAILSHARRRHGEKALILGDFNTGRRFQDGPPPEQSGWAPIHGCESLLGSLLSLGFVDAWRCQNPTTREFSWVSWDGQARRIDAAYLSPALGATLQTAAYSQLEREAGLSDHAPLVVDLSLPKAPTHAADSPGLFAPKPAQAGRVHPAPGEKAPVS